MSRRRSSRRRCVPASCPSRGRSAAHLTLARLPRARDASPVVEALDDAPFGGPWPVNEVVVVSSDTRPTGVVYEEVARIPLDAG